jgi:hypothetical protein
MDGGDASGVLVGTFRRIDDGRFRQDAVQLVRCADRWLVRCRVGGQATVVDVGGETAAHVEAVRVMREAGGVWVYYPPPCRHRPSHGHRTRVAS